MTSWGLIGGLEVLPALAVPCGFASAASFVCFVFYRVLSSIRLSVKVHACCHLDSAGLVGWLNCLFLYHFAT